MTESFKTTAPAQVIGLAGYTVDPIFTIGETFKDYTPPGILDGMGAYELNDNTVRVLVNHELSNNVGYAYTLSSGVSLRGARVSYFDIDKKSMKVVDTGLAYNKIYNRAGEEVTSTNPLDTIEGQFGLDRFCSANLFTAGEYGFVDTIFFTGEETDDGTEFALDTANNALWALPWLGVAAWENVTALDTGTTDKIALLVGDDRQTAPLLLYVGTKGVDHNSDGSIDFLERNGLTHGDLFVWVSDTPSTLDPRQFNGTGNSNSGKFVEIDIYDETGTLAGYDELGFATQVTQDALGDAVGAFSFSRPEDVATNPNDGTQAVLASTGRTGVFDNKDTWGTTYIVDVDFSGLPNHNITADLKIIYDGNDAGGGVFSHPDYGMRSPDNLDWGDDGKIYIQEDRAISSSLFGATSGLEASLWRIDPSAPNPAETITRIGITDPTALPNGQTNASPNDIGNWETSGIIDVSRLFDKKPGELFLFDVQAHSIRDGSIISVPGIDTDGDGVVEADDNLVQGGQLAFLSAPPKTVNGTSGDDYFDTAFPDEKNFVGAEQNLFTGSGDDTVDVSVMGEGNRIDTGSGDDMVFAGTNNRIILGAGNDILFAGYGEGGNNITGGMGADEFWLITDIDAIPTMNKISDFKASQGDVIGFANTDLSLANKGSDWNYERRGNNVIISVDGQEIAQLLNTTITDANFVFA